MAAAAAAATSSAPYTISSKLSMVYWREAATATARHNNKSKRMVISISCQMKNNESEAETETEAVNINNNNTKKQPPPLRPVEPQKNVKSKNMGREYGGQWLSSVTRHVRIYAAYIDPITCEFDQTQTDKLTILLDPSNEFVWNPQTCNKVYGYFQELVDHYEGAPLTEYTLRLIGSDIEHYIRKMLYDGEIKYNMDARVLNFSMGKPRIMFNNNDLSQNNTAHS